MSWKSFIIQFIIEVKVLCSSSCQAEDRQKCTQQIPTFPCPWVPVCSTHTQMPSVTLTWANTEHLGLQHSCTAGHLQSSSYIYQSSKRGDSCDPADVKPQESSWDLPNARPCWNPRAQVQTTTETSLLLCCPRGHQRDGCGRAAQASKLHLVHRQMQNRNSHCTEGSRQPRIKRIQEWQKEHCLLLFNISVLQAEPLATTEIPHH